MVKRLPRDPASVIVMSETNVFDSYYSYILSDFQPNLHPKQLYNSKMIFLTLDLYTKWGRLSNVYII